MTALVFDGNQIYNIENALAAIATALQAGIDIEAIKAGLKSYDGAKRRFEVRYGKDEIMIVEDYAHHPTEIKATIAAAMRFKRRIVCVFHSPHPHVKTCL